MILSDEEIKESHAPYPVFRDSHLEANARIRELEGDIRIVALRLQEAMEMKEWLRLATIQRQRANRAEAKLRELAEIVDAYFEGGLGPVDAMKQVTRIVDKKEAKEG